MGCSPSVIEPDRMFFVANATNITLWVKTRHDNLSLEELHVHKGHDRQGKIKAGKLAVGMETQVSKKTDAIYRKGEVVEPGKYVTIILGNGQTVCDMAEAPIGRSLIVKMNDDEPGVCTSKLLHPEPKTKHYFTD